ncbi:hypothetical protein Tco_1179739 [Tanacetum coccineum]
MSMTCLAYELYWNILSRNINPVVTQQVALDNSLLAPEKRLKIERCNARIEFSKPQREETYQVTLEALKISPCYHAFQITTEVLEIYMQQFWNTIKKIRNTYAYNFKLDKKKCRVDTERNVDYVALLWEDFMYQADNRKISSARKEHMPYPRFTKVIINHFISKDKTIFMRNRINLHTIRDDSLLGTLKYVSKIEDSHKYDCSKESKEIKKIASPLKQLTPVSEEEPTKKSKRIKRPAKKSTTMPTTGVVIRDTPGVSVSKKKAPAKADKSKGIELLSDAALLVPDESKAKPSDTSEGTGVKPRVPNVSKAASSDSDDESWGNSKDETDDVNDDVKDDVKDDDNDDDNDNDDEVYLDE